TTLNQTLAFATNPVNNAGTVTNVSVGTGTAFISAPVGPNVTSLIQNSATAPFTVNSPITLSNGSPTLVSSAAALFTVSGTGITGSGTLSVNANSTGNFTISTTPINH